MQDVFPASADVLSRVVFLAARATRAPRDPNSRLPPHHASIDPEGRWHAKHIAIMIVADLIPIQSIFALDGHRPSNQFIKTPTQPQARFKTATGQGDDGHAAKVHRSSAEVVA